MFGAGVRRDKLLRHGETHVSVVRGIDPLDGADPAGTTDGSHASVFLASSSVLVVAADGDRVPSDLEKLLDIAVALVERHRRCYVTLSTVGKD